jgi:polyphosphate kinase
VLVRLPTEELVAEVGEVLDLAFAENTAAWTLGPDGAWSRTPGPDAGETVHLQEFLIDRQRKRR